MLRFDPEKHIYYIDDKQEFSVTQVMDDVRIIDPTWYTEESRERGSLVHKITELLDQGVLDWDSVDPALEPYIQAYETFLSDYMPEYDYIEKRVYDPICRFAGTLDRAGRFHGKKHFILDIKTGQIQEWTRLQTAAYQYCLAKEDPKYSHTKLVPRYGLQLNNDGTYNFDNKYHPSTFADDIKTFKSALCVAQWKRRFL
jgi:hypothetical protein